MKLSIFNETNLFDAATDLFVQLGIKLNSNTTEPLNIKNVLGEYAKDTLAFISIEQLFFVGIIDESIFSSLSLLNAGYSYSDALTEADKNYDGLMLFAVHLSKQPSRTEISELTRAFNRVSQKMPVGLLIKHNIGDETAVSLAISERFKYKQNWRQGERAGKVIILKDIKTEQTHAGHQRILLDLVKPARVTNYAQLHAHWLEVLDVSTLNKKFFRELSNWYFWAVSQTSFPQDAKDNDNEEARRAKPVIRLITRLMFVWFLKEKGLISNELFNKRELNGILKFDDESAFYKAILQNLFFAALNTDGEDAKTPRKFRNKKTEKSRYDQNVGVANVFRYENEFINPQDTLEKYFLKVPFLNGGLFECLDKPEEKIYVDGFSERKDNVLSVPDELFFCEECVVDLSGVYYDAKKSKEKVRGLIRILDNYKFTIAENTPVEEEIALDPELLGKVFENLLANYNPETRTTARKQTGSFYTPREIVNYMVDESLIAYLKAKLQTETKGFGFIAFGESQETLFGNEARVQQKFELPVAENRWLGKDADLENALCDLFGYNETENKFNETETEILIKAINDCKILDPACGSGAFPMGILQRLVFLLGKLDKADVKWRALQKQEALKQIETAYDELKDQNERQKRIDEIDEVFDLNSSDYGRKLFLIENCIYGVDIQPVAIQISKLRFFISLIIDQKIDESRPNRGVRPLPNLETKLVAANTLLRLESQAMLKPSEVPALEKELKEVRSEIFRARTPSTKLKWRERDKEIRLTIADLLKKTGYAPDAADKIANWSPDNQDAHADWFDAEWMFGIEKGFDIAIGNPPYLSKNFSDFDKRYFKKNYKTAQYQLELYVLFIEAMTHAIRPKGVLSFITPNSWLKNMMMSDCRKFILDNLSVFSINPNIANAFEAASVDTAIFVAQKVSQKGSINVWSFVDSNIIQKNKVEQKRFYQNDKYVFDVEVSDSLRKTFTKIKSNSKPLITFVDISRGINPYDSYTGQTQEIIKSKAYHANFKKDKTFVPEIRGKHVQTYIYNWDEKHFISYGDWLAAPREAKYFQGERLVLREILGEKLICAFIEEKLKIDRSLYIAIPKANYDTNIKFLVGVISTKLLSWFFRLEKNEFDDLFPKIRVEEFKNLPIPKSTEAQQNAIAEIVDEIIEAKKVDAKANTKALEAKIDNIVYDLYDLTEDEIAIVERK